MSMNTRKNIGSHQVSLVTSNIYFELIYVFQSVYVERNVELCYAVISTISAAEAPEETPNL